MIRPVEWRNGAVVLLDQRLLPTQEVYRVYRDHREVAEAIKSMVVRGAPAIGVAAAMGIALGAQQTPPGELGRNFDRICKRFAATRPTAVNLFWAIDRMKRTFAAGVQAGESVADLTARLEREALAIHDEDVASCRAMGRLGASLVPEQARVLTHCNAGALATAGYGTALGVIRAAAEQGRITKVFADETRPFLQGARLTAWELVRDGVPNVWVRNVDGSEPRQLTFRSVPCGRARWSPDGKQIAFVSFDGKYPQLFVVPAEGGEPRQLTHVDGAVHSIEWAPPAASR